MKGIRLSFNNDTQLAASAAWLRACHPLSFTAPVKKSQMHHALCEMVTEVRVIWLLQLPVLL